MSEYYIGQVIMSGFTFPPEGFVTCNGQILPVAQYQALFSLLGNQFGGSTNVNFALPDMRGRTVVGYGQSSDGTMYPVGPGGGTPTVTLTATQLPAHTHAVNASTAAGTVGISGHILAASSEGNVYFGNPDDKSGTLVPLANANGVVGGNGAHNNMQPYQVQNFIIVTAGYYPQRP